MEQCDGTVCTEGEQVERCKDKALCVLSVKRWSDVRIFLCVY
jgi:hypothetical protein